MKLTCVFLLGCLAVASASFMTKESKFADHDFLVKQKWVFDLFEHVYQHDMECPHYKIAEAYNIEKHFDDYTGDEVAQTFWTMYKKDFLPMEEIFSVTVSDHNEQMTALFELFYYAKDWDTFVNTVTWARFHINPDMFVYAFTAAILHRKDTTGLILPAIYEINPFYFYPSDMVQKAQSYKMRNFHGLTKVDGYYSAYVVSNYSNWFETYGDESHMNYYTEDVGLNAYYYYFHMDYPYWMGGEKYELNKDRRGEYYLYQYQQFLARYYLERLSNNLGEVDEFSFEHFEGDGYYPRLRYFNGMAFPYRTEEYIQHDHSIIDLVDLFEERVKNAVDMGYFYAKDGTKIDFTKPESIEYLGNLMQANDDSKNDRFFGFWENNAKTVLSPTFWFDHENVIPGVMEHFETAMRDPIFYQFYKRFLNSYWLFKDHLPAYTKDELDFPTVKIQSVFVDKLITYFDFFDADISNVVDADVSGTTDKTHVGSHLGGDDFVIYGRTHRLNHAEFTVKLTVKSEAVQKAVVKFFIGPKYNVHGHEYDIVENRENWYELDHYVVDLVAGENVLTRRSTDFSWFVNDRTTYFDLYKNVMLALDGKFKFPLDMSEAHCGFPRRLMLPKGTKGGMPFEMFFFVYPYHEPKVKQFTGFDATISCGVGSGARNIDTTPFGYPFDRPIDHYIWPTPNMMFYDTMVYFKEHNEINKTN